MTTWGTLKSDLARILSRADLGGEEGVYLRLAEARINRDVRCRAMVHWHRVRPANLAVVGLQVDAGVSFVGFTLRDLVESNWSGPLIAVDTVAFGLGQHKAPLDRVTVEQLLEQCAVSGRSSRPTVFAEIVDDEGEISIALAPPPTPSEDEENLDLTLIVTCLFGFALDTNSDASSNWLLRQHYDIYFAATAAEACAQIQDFERMGIFETRYKQGVDALHRAENAARSAGSVINTSPSLYPGRTIV